MLYEQTKLCSIVFPSCLQNVFWAALYGGGIFSLFLMIVSCKLTKFFKYVICVLFVSGLCLFIVTLYSGISGNIYQISFND